MANNQFIRSQLMFSATRIEVLQSCLRKYYYEYVKPNKKNDVIYTDLTLGLYFHKMAELFWRNSEPGNLKPFYKKKESFINSSLGYFKRYIIGIGSLQGRKIEWRSKDEKFILLNSVVPDVLSKFYDRSMNESPPLAVEIPFKILVDGVFYVGRIDEIRKGENGTLVIRDHKYKPYAVPKVMETEFNPQFTLYNFALAADLRSLGEITRALKIDKDEAARIAGPNIISDNITLEYHLFKQDQIIPAQRKSEHYYDLQETIEGLIGKLETAYSTGSFYAQRGRNCDFCLHKDRCTSDTLNNIETRLPVQIDLFPIDLRFKKPSKGHKQTSLRFPKDKKE